MSTPRGKIRTSAYIPEILYSKLIQLSGAKKGRQSEIITDALKVFLEERLKPLERWRWYRITDAGESAVLDSQFTYIVIDDILDRVMVLSSTSRHTVKPAILGDPK